MTMTFEQIAREIATKGEFKRDWASYYLLNRSAPMSDERFMAARRQVVRMAEAIEVGAEDGRIR